MTRVLPIAAGVLMVALLLAGCSGPADRSEVLADSPPSDLVVNDAGDGRGEPVPMNAPPVMGPPGDMPVGQGAPAPEPLDRGVPICPGDPRCKGKKR